MKFVKFVCTPRVCHVVRTLFGKSKHNAINVEKQSTAEMNTGQIQGDTHTVHKNVRLEQMESKEDIQKTNKGQKTITVKILINTIDKVGTDLDVISGRYIVDAKSIIGIFSLDLTSPLELKIYAKDDESLSKTIEEMREFFV